MLVPLLPLFLAANVNVNQNNWKYGPELIFNVKFDGVSPPLGTLGKAVMFNATMKLSCRPKSELILMCNYVTKAVVLTLLKPINKTLVPGKSKVFHDRRNDDDFFELNFDPDSNDTISIPSGVGKYKHQIVNALVDQFKAGMRVKPKLTGRFHIMENSSVGVCPTTYIVTAHNITVETGEITPHEIIIFPDIFLREASMDINISRNLRECWGSPSNSTDRKFVMTVVESESHVMITTRNFTSYTDYEVCFQDEVTDSWTNRRRYSFGRERVTVSLDKIVPANGPLPDIQYTKSHQAVPTAFTSASFVYVFHPDDHVTWLQMVESQHF